MRVTLARDYKDHRANETVDLPRGEATNLIHLGLARRAANRDKTRAAEPAEAEPARRKTKEA